MCLCGIGKPRNARDVDRAGKACDGSDGVLDGGGAAQAFADHHGGNIEITPHQDLERRQGVADGAHIAARHQQDRQPQLRHGFWFSGGLGYGSLGCQNCSGRTGALSGNISLGGTLSPKLLLGVSTNGWTKSDSGATLTVGTLTAAVRFYPSATGGFFMTGGLGLGTVSAGVSGFGSASQTGVAGLLGLGYDIPVGRSVSLTPYWNGFALSYSGGDANVGQIGLGITVH